MNEVIPFEKEGIRFVVRAEPDPRNPDRIQAALQVEAHNGNGWESIIGDIFGLSSAQDWSSLAVNLWRRWPRISPKRWREMVQEVWRAVRPESEPELLPELPVLSRDDLSPATNPRWKGKPISVIANQPGMKADWLWEGFLARGCITDFYGFWKSGKTTLVAALLHHMAAGGALAGRMVRAGKALVVTEEAESLWAERYEAFRLQDNVFIISRPFLKRPTLKEWEAFITCLVQQVVEEKFDLVVFDALPNLWPVEDENDAAQVIAALMPLMAVTQAGAAVLLIRHPRKSGGAEGTAGRGSGAVSGFVDVIVEMRRYRAEEPEDTRRVLTVYSRFEPFEMVIRWNGGPDYEALGAPGAYETRAQREQLLEALAENEGATAEELAQVLGMPFKTVHRHLQELLRAGRVRREGTGKRGSPYRWFLAEAREAQFTPSLIESEKDEKNPETPSPEPGLFSLSSHFFSREEFENNLEAPPRIPDSSHSSQPYIGEEKNLPPEAQTEPPLEISPEASPAEVVKPAGAKMCTDCGEVSDGLSKCPKCRARLLSRLQEMAERSRLRRAAPH